MLIPLIVSLIFVVQLSSAHMLFYGRDCLLDRHKALCCSDNEEVVLNWVWFTHNAHIMWPYYGPYKHLGGHLTVVVRGHRDWTEKRGNLAESLNGNETALGYEEAYAKFLGHTNCSGMGSTIPWKNRYNWAAVISSWIPDSDHFADDVCEVRGDRWSYYDFQCPTEQEFCTSDLNGYVCCTSGPN